MEPGWIFLFGLLYGICAIFCIIDTIVNIYKIGRDEQLKRDIEANTAQIFDNNVILSSMSKRLEKIEANTKPKKRVARKQTK